MTDAQKRLREALDRQSRARARMAEIGIMAEADWTPEVRSEFEALEKAVPDTEAQVRAARAAVEAEESEQRQQTVEHPDGEQRERIELRSRARLTNYLLAAAQGRMVSGAERELQEAAEVGGIPLELFEVPQSQRRETRADMATGAPTSGTGINLDPIRPLIYARAVLPRLGVAMPRTRSGAFATATISTGLSAAAKAKSAAQESTAAAFTAQTTTPHRVSARLSITLEDVATVGVENFESALRQNLMLALSDRLDHLGLTGDGQAPNPSGLLTQLTDPSDPTAVIDWNGFTAAVADGIDGGPWAESMMSVKVLVNPETQRLAERTFKDGTGFGGEMSAAAYLRAHSGGFFSSRRMPDSASNIAQALRVRMGTMGLEGVDAMRLATCPVWAEVGIDDITSDSASGIRHFTLHHLIGDVLIEQSSGFEQIAFRLA